jgi:sensor c-di-GMP phosphodiesterase-like protein
VGPVPRLIAHHTSELAFAVEAAILCALVAFFGWVWLRERRRRVNRRRRVPEMRD